MGNVLSINLAVPEVNPATRSAAPTGIHKVPAAGAVLVRPPAGRSGSGVAGDQVFNAVHHGGADQAVYAYAREDLDWWQHELGRDLPGGLFGENLTTAGVAVNDALIGERWRVGGALLQVTLPRVPCRTFQRTMAERRWVKRFTAAGRPGAYLKVLEAGEISAGDTVTVVYRPAHDVGIAMCFRAVTTEPELLPRLLELDEVPEKLKRSARKRLSRPAPD